MIKPSAKIICDSVSPDGNRLTTMEVVMHRFVLAEFNTHRAFSRNSASSRAIPTSKLLERVEIDPALPLFYGVNKSGMQAEKELIPQGKLFAEFSIKELLTEAIYTVRNLTENHNLHKQNSNRYIEPWMWHTAIVSATDWDNFFYQRCSEFAQPEIKALADAMQLAYYTSTPNLVKYGEWHLPYIDDETKNEVADSVSKMIVNQSVQYFHRLKAISVARCARVSYLNHDGKRSIEDDFSLYEKLITGNHWSPFEHVAKPLDNGRNGNFLAWKQFRKEFKNENVTKFIPNLPELQEIAQEIAQEMINEKA